MLFRSHVQIVQTLLTKDGIDVNKPEENGITPLIIATNQGHVAVVRLLLSQPNIDINKIAHNNSALGWATQQNHNDIVQLLTDAGATLPIPFCRGKADQIGLHTKLSCANGHGMIRFQTPNEYGCDLCERGVPEGKIMYGCDECDYDVCVTCETNSEL